MDMLKNLEKKNQKIHSEENLKEQTYGLGVGGG